MSFGPSSRLAILSDVMRRPATQDFEKYDSVEITQSIQTRRTRIFLLMEEVRRLRIEQRLKVGP